MVDHVHLGRVWGKHGHLRTLPTEVDQAAGERGGEGSRREERGERGEGVQESYVQSQARNRVDHVHSR